MPVIKKNEQFPERSIVVMLVGTPFSRKTSLASTAKNAILIDADRGADRAYGRPDTFVLQNGWAELLQEDEAGTFREYSTIIHDTAKAILDDYLMEYVISKNYKLKTNKMQMYGAIGDEYKLYVNKHRNAQQDIIIIAHDRTKDDDGVNTISPDITGGSKNLLLRICDQVGYVTNKRVQRNGNWVDIVTVNFTPTQEAPFCKNVAGLAEIELPHYSKPEWKDFMETHIIQPTKDAIMKMTEEQRAALEIIAEWQSAIDVIVEDGRDMDAELKAINKDIKEKITPEHLQKQVVAYLLGHLKKIGYKWDGKGGVFIKVDGSATEKAKVAEKPKEAAPVANTTPEATAIAEASATETVDAATVEPHIDLAAEAEQQRADLGDAQVINKNPHLAEPKADLFGAKK